MAPDHQLSERVYSALKTDLLNGDMPGLRLPITRLEARYHTSATPVREALLRLVGEGIVELNPAGGFSIARPTERQVEDLYELNLAVTLAAASWPRALLEGLRTDTGISTSIGSVNDVFSAIGTATGNSAMAALIESLNDRMRRIRRAEIAVVDELGREIRAIDRYFRQGDLPRLRRALIAYHRRRVRNSARIVTRLLANTHKAEP